MGQTNEGEQTYPYKNNSTNKRGVLSTSPLKNNYLHALKQPRLFEGVQIIIQKKSGLGIHIPKPDFFDFLNARQVVLTNIFLENAVAIGVTQLTQRLSFNLANTLTGHIENLANLFQGFHATIV